MTPNWRGQEEEWMCSRAGLLFRGNSVSQRHGSAKTLWNSTRTDAKSCPWEGRPPGSYRQGAEELGSRSAKEARGSWLAPSGTWASNAPWQQGHPAAPWAALATAPPADQGKGPSIFRPDLGCCLQLGLPVEKRLGQTRASLGYPQDGQGGSSGPMRRTLDSWACWGAPTATYLPLPTGRLLSHRDPSFSQKDEGQRAETREVQAIPSGPEVKQVVQEGCAVSTLGGLSRKSPEQLSLISYLMMLWTRAWTRDLLMSLPIWIIL